MRPIRALDLSSLTGVVYSHGISRGTKGYDVLAEPSSLSSLCILPLGDPSDGVLLETKQSLSICLLRSQGYLYSCQGPRQCSQMSSLPKLSVVKASQHQPMPYSSFGEL